MLLCSVVEEELDRQRRREGAPPPPAPRTRSSRTSSDRGSSDDDLFRRLVRDANSTPDARSRHRGPRDSAEGLQGPTSAGHYAWAEPDGDRYRSRFLPMRRHDLVRDDMAYRQLVRGDRRQAGKDAASATSATCSGTHSQ